MLAMAHVWVVLTDDSVPLAIWQPRCSIGTLNVPYTMWMRSSQMQEHCALSGETRAVDLPRLDVFTPPHISLFSKKHFGVLQLELWRGQVLKMHAFHKVSEDNWHAGTD